MDKAGFRAALGTLGLTVASFAELTGWSAATVYEWGSRSPVPYQARCILWLLAERKGVRIDGLRPPPLLRPRLQADRFRIGP